MSNNNSNDFRGNERLQQNNKIDVQIHRFNITAGSTHKKIKNPVVIHRLHNGIGDNFF
jgi:hypothetical protein